MQPLQNCIGPTIRIGREILCLPYAEFFLLYFLLQWIVLVVLMGLVAVVSKVVVVVAVKFVVNIKLPMTTNTIR